MRIDHNPIQEKFSSTGPLVLPPVITAPVTPLEPLTKPQFDAQKPHGVEYDKDAPLDIHSAKSELTELIEHTDPTSLQKNAHTIPKPSDIEDETDETQETETEGLGIGEILHEGVEILKEKALELIHDEVSETVESETDEMEKAALKEGAKLIASKVMDLVQSDGEFDGKDLLDVAIGIGKAADKHHHEESIDDDDDDDEIADMIGKLKPFNKEEYEASETRKRIDSRVAELIAKADNLYKTLDLTAVTLGPDVSVLFSQFSEIAHQLSLDMYQVLSKVHQSDKLDGDIFQKFADKLDSANDYNTEMLSKLNRNSKLQLKLVMQMISGKIFHQMDALHRAQTGGDPHAAVPAALQMLNQLQDKFHVI